MFKIFPLASSSDANAFIIQDGLTTILLDAGLKSDQIKAKMFDLGITHSSLDAIFITHEHMDHSRGVSFLSKKFPIYASNGTFSALEGVRNQFIKNKKVIKVYDEIKIKTLKILAIGASHDANEPLNFVITNACGEKICYITDTGVAGANIKTTLDDISQQTKVMNAHAYIIESNHFESVVDNKIKNSTTEHEIIRLTNLKKRHLSFEKTSEYLLKCIGDKTELVLLMHISKENDNLKFLKENMNSVLKKEGTKCVHHTNHNHEKSNYQVGVKIV